MYACKHGVFLYKIIIPSSLLTYSLKSAGFFPTSTNECVINLLMCITHRHWFSLSCSNKIHIWKLFQWNIQLNKSYLSLRLVKKRHEHSHSRRMRKKNRNKRYTYISYVAVWELKLKGEEETEITSRSFNLECLLWKCYYSCHVKIIKNEKKK